MQKTLKISKNHSKSPKINFFRIHMVPNVDFNENNTFICSFYTIFVGFCVILMDFDGFWVDFGWFWVGFWPKNRKFSKKFFFSKKNFMPFFESWWKMEWKQNFFLGVILTVTFWPILAQKILMHFQRGHNFRWIWPENHSKSSKINAKSMQNQWKFTFIGTKTPLQ